MHAELSRTTSLGIVKPKETLDVAVPHSSKKMVHMLLHCGYSSLLVFFSPRNGRSCLLRLLLLGKLRLVVVLGMRLLVDIVVRLECYLVQRKNGQNP